ncbi:MAG: hypothetical protein JRF24_10180 [Deltaproteobacteria bacterium]|nr:hypothetical protein [Deltaproteobacteria bacterium]
MKSIEGLSDNDKVIEGIFFFDPKDNIYKDHFPGYPVVPGSLIVHAFVTAAKRQGWIYGGWSLEDFRFTYFVSPGKCQFRIRSYDDGNFFECELRSEGKLSATGRLRP